MTREKFNQIFNSKAYYIIFSLVAAIVLWVYVEVSEIEIMSHIVSNIPVSLIHEDILNDRGFLLSTMSADTISVTFECSRSDAQKLSRDTLMFTIDMSGITATGSYTLRATLESFSDVDLEDIEFYPSVDEVTVIIDRTMTESVPVEVLYTGGTAEGFVQDPIEYSPHAITVSGPAEIVSQVSRVRVNIVRENLSSTFSEDLPFVFLDGNGDALDAALRNQLTTLESTIHVVIPIRVTKEIALTIETSQSPGSAGATPQNTSVTITPSTITVAGSPDDLRDFNSINLGTIDLTRFDHANTYTYGIAIPNIFANISGETEAHVQVEISGLDIVYFTITNIQPGNIPSGYTAEIRTQSIDVRVRGRAEDLALLTEENFRILANLPTEVSTGTQQVSARVIIDGIDADIGAVGNYFVTMHIIRE